MGCGCSQRVKEDKEEDDIVKQVSPQKNYLKKQTALSKKSFTSVYHLYQYQHINTYNQNNLLVFTTINHLQNEFVSIDESYKDMTYNKTFKAQGVAVGYSKGYKLDVNNQDKFFILLDGDVEIYCLIDGHGPYGNIIAQLVQDRFFSV